MPVFIVRNKTEEPIELCGFGVLLPPGQEYDLGSRDRAVMCSEIAPMLAAGDIARVIDGVEVPYAQAFQTEAPVSIARLFDLDDVLVGEDGNIITDEEGNIVVRG